MSVTDGCDQRSRDWSAAWLQSKNSHVPQVSSCLVPLRPAFVLAIYIITLHEIHKKRIFAIQFLQPTNLDEKLTALRWKTAALVCPFPPFSTSQLTTIFILVLSTYKTV